MRLICLFVILVTGTTLVIGQTRTNTEQLGKKLLEESAGQRAEAKKLETKIDAANAAVEAAQRRLNEIEKERAEIARKLDEIRARKTRLLGEVVWDIMNDAEIGDLVRAKPERIRMIPAIQETLRANPWLDPVLEEILKDYR